MEKSCMTSPPKTVIWGNGLVGTALKHHEMEFNQLNLSIIAAGVADSKNATDADYNREVSFLESILSKTGNSQRHILYNLYVQRE